MNRRIYNQLAHLEPISSSRKLHERIYRDVLEKGLEFNEAKQENLEGIELFAKILALHKEYAEKVDPWGDMFGEYLAESEQLRGPGQFLTPINVCDAMVAMTIFEDSFKEPQRILDPAAGTGRFMLRTAKHYAEKAGCFNFIFTNIDIDFRVWIYCTMNAILKAIPSINIWGNSLTLEFREALVTIPVGWPIAPWARADVKALEEGMRRALRENAKIRNMHDYLDVPYTTPRVVDVKVNTKVNKKVISKLDEFLQKR